MTTTTTQLTLNEIRDRGYAALLRELGPRDYVRFLQQFQVGEGDYTKQRHDWLDRLTEEQIQELIANHQIKVNP